MATETVLSNEEMRERADLAAHATAEIDALLRMLGREAGTEGFDLVLRAALLRSTSLTSVVLSVLGDDYLRATSELREVVHG